MFTAMMDSIRLRRENLGRPMLGNHGPPTIERVQETEKEVKAGLEILRQSSEAVEKYSALMNNITDRDCDGVYIID